MITDNMLNSLKNKESAIETHLNYYAGELEKLGFIRDDMTKQWAHPWTPPDNIPLNTLYHVTQYSIEFYCEKFANELKPIGGDWIYRFKYRIVATNNDMVLIMLVSGPTGLSTFTTHTLDKHPINQLPPITRFDLASAIVLNQ